MSVIALTGVPMMGSIQEVLKPLKSLIKGHFEAMNFIWNKNKSDRTAFLRLSEKLDPVEVVERINSRKRGPLRAYIPNEVPNFPLSKRSMEKMPADKMLIVSIDFILQEMQSKYAGLYDLSGSTAHKLLHDIAKTLYKRLRKILEQDDSAGIDCCLRLSKAYRIRYPHFADFQMILSTLHSIQDTEGKPRLQIHECDLTNFTLQSYVFDNIPFDKVQNAYYKYLDKVTATVVDHVKNLDMTPVTTSPEEITRIKIREQLKVLLPYIPTSIKHVTDLHFIPQESIFYTVHIYGEPALPSKESFTPFLKRHKVMSTKRSNRLYNLIIVEVPKSEYTAVFEADGSLIGSSKLVIRPSNLPYYRLPRLFISSMQASYVNESMAEDANKEEWASKKF